MGNLRRTFARDGIWRARREGGDDKFISSIVHRSDGRMDGHAISSWRVEKEERERGREKARGEKYSQTFSEA